MIYDILEESEMERNLKSYFNFTERVFGEDVALEMATVSPSIKDSLSCFSKRFDMCADIDVYLSILKTCAIVGDETKAVQDANSLIASNHIDELIQDMQANKGMTKEILKTFIRYSCMTSSELLQRKVNLINSFDSVSERLHNIEDYYSAQKDLCSKKKVSK